MRLRTVYTLSLCSLLLAAPLSAGESLDPDAMQASMAKIISDPVAREAATQAGQARGTFCTFCHGKTGISKKDWIPNMAGQSARFILDQNIAYATGEREHKLMNELAASMSAEELINISVFYAVQKAETIQLEVGEPTLTVASNFYKEKCAECHGDDGKGEKGYTWIAGQKPEYVRRALARYRDQKGRLDPEMAEATSGISDKLIDDVARYLTTFK